MPIRRLSLAVSPVLRFADWLFTGEASGVDLIALLGSAWWLFLMLFRPDVFDRAQFAGMSWAPDGFWIIFVASVVVMHGLALWRPRMYRLRMGAALMSAWYWITVAVSLSAPGVSTGSGIYAIAGGVAVMLAVYLSGRSAHRA